MNYVYDPKNQAPIAEYINYVTPVEGVQEVFEKQARNWQNELIFPSASFTKKCSPTPPIEGEEEQNINPGVRRGVERLSGWAARTNAGGRRR